MGSGYSKAAKKAFTYFLSGMTVAKSAKKAGCAESTLYRYPAYQEHVKARKS